MWALIVLGLAAVATLVGLAILNGEREQAAATVEVPDVVDMTQEAAQQELQAVGLTMERLEEPSDTVDEGVVTRSDPGGGTEVDTGSTVRVWVSAGPDAVAIPDVAGMTQEQATAELRDAGFDVGSVEFENAPRVPRNEVTKTVPPAGETHPLDTPVVLYVASGQVDLPDLVGKPRAEALKTLEDLGLSSTITEEESDAAPDSVIAQDRSPGQVPQTTSVGLTIAVAPTTVQVPDLVGESYDDAAAALTELGLVPVRADIQSDQPEGQVISTEPGQGTTVDIGSEVTVNVAIPAPEEDGNGGDEGDANAAGGGNGTEGGGNGTEGNGNAGNGNGGNGNGNGNGNN